MSYYFVFGNLLLNVVDKFARMTKIGQRRLRVAKPLNVLVECRVEAQYVAQMFLKVALHTHRPSVVMRCNRSTPRITNKDGNN